MCRRAIVIFLLVGGLVGCAARGPLPDRTQIGRTLDSATGRDDLERSIAQGPPGIDPAAPLTADDAVALALWRNHRFRAALAALDIAEADAIQAGLLRNPVLSLIFPWGPKQYEAALSWPVDALLGRRRRVDLARLDAARVADELVASGLELIREVRIGHAELQLAAERRLLAVEAADAADEIRRLTRLLVDEGDVGLQELNRSRAGAARRRLTAETLTADHGRTTARLAALIGAPRDEVRTADLAPAAVTAPPAFDALVELALAARPDVRASELAIERAGAEAGLARADALALVATLDLNEADDGRGVNLGPALSVGLPVFDRGQGRRARAAARLRQAMLDHERAAAETIGRVRERRLTWLAAQGSHRRWTDELLPAEQAAFDAARDAHEAGDLSRLELLGARLAWLDARDGAAAAGAALRVARAELEAALGAPIPDTTREISRRLER